MRSIRPPSSTSRISARPDPARRLLLTGAAAAAGASLAGCGAAQEEALARGDDRFISVEGVALHYTITGSGPKAVVIHGASGNLRDWSMGPAEVLGRTNTLLMFDRPGLGRSGRPEKGGADPFVQARLMRKAAARLGFARPVLVGHSYGGAVALAWALDAPEAVAGLLLVSAPSQVWPGGVGLLYDLTVNPVTGPLLSRILPVIASDRLIGSVVKRVFAPQSPPPDYIEKLGIAQTLHPATIQANAADINALKNHLRRMVPRYRVLDTPAEIVHGTADGVVPLKIHSERLVRQLPAARLTRLEGIGHMPHHVATDAVAAALRRLNARI